MKHKMKRTIWAQPGKEWGVLFERVTGFALSMIFFVPMATCPTALPGAQGWATPMQKVYMDESHCLVSPEMRSDNDNPISCYCRDAIADARYVYFTYVSVASPHSDPNLMGPFLALQRNARQECSRAAERLDSDFIAKIESATTSKDWQWNGPEVVRTYPPDKVIRQIKPDSRGWISVGYTAVLLWRDSRGQVTKTESLSAIEEGPAEFMLSKPASQKRPARNVPPND